MKVYIYCRSPFYSHLDEWLEKYRQEPNTLVFDNYKIENCLATPWDYKNINITESIEKERKLKEDLQRADSVVFAIPYEYYDHTLKRLQILLPLLVPDKHVEILTCK